MSAFGDLGVFADRAEAGRLLAERLSDCRNRRDTLVLALPRGGVPVAYEIASALQLPLDVFVVRKIGVPSHPELAMGAVASDGTYSVNRDVLSELNVTSDRFLAVFEDELEEARRREQAYRKGRAQAGIAGKTVILVDDGLATGSTMQVAIDAMHRQHAASVILAVPVAPVRAKREFANVVDRFVCALTPEPFYAVGAYYANFDQVDDAEVDRLLTKAAASVHAA